MPLARFKLLLSRRIYVVGLIAGACTLALSSGSHAQESSTPAQQSPGSAAESEPATPTSPAQGVDEPTRPSGASRAPTGPLDFQHAIRPILEQHCTRCHGPMKRSGGLRLDTPELASEGGDSGKPVLGGTLATNELWARVSSSDRTFRMPKNSMPLSAEEIGTIRRWIEAGSQWGTKSNASRIDAPFYERWLIAFEQFAHQYQAELDFLRPYAFAFVALQVLLLIVGRMRTAYLKGKPRALASRLCRACGKVRITELTLAWLLSVALLSIVWFVGRERHMAGKLVMAQKISVEARSHWTGTVYGYPPMPVRPGHPKQLAGVYYRGNCERSDQLFNGGNYLTATFRVNLVDAKHEDVKLGSSFPADGLFVRIEIERAPGTTETLFSKELMGNVFLSEEFFDDAVKSPPKRPISRLEVAEEDRRWVAFVPVTRPNEHGMSQGLIYIYTGSVTAEMARGEPHYAVRYDLYFKDGLLDAESDVWMNSFGNGAVAAPEPAGKIPYHEWFDYKPIPEIVGENTKDSKLLGIDERVEQGLIPPPAKDGQPDEKPGTAPKQAEAGSSPMTESPEATPPQ